MPEDGAAGDGRGGKGASAEPGAPVMPREAGVPAQAGPAAPVQGAAGAQEDPAAQDEPASGPMPPPPPKGALPGILPGQERIQASAGPLSASELRVLEDLGEVQREMAAEVATEAPRTTTAPVREPAPTPAPGSGVGELSGEAAAPGQEAPAAPSATAGGTLALWVVGPALIVLGLLTLRRSQVGGVALVAVGAGVLLGGLRQARAARKA